MRGARTGLLLVSVLLAAAGCSNPQAGPQAADYEKQRAEIIARRQSAKDAAKVARRETAQPGAAAAPAAGGGFAGAARAGYDPSGKRDPFRSFILDRLKELEAQAKGPLEQFDLAQLKLHGVVWQSERPRALVADPSGQVYVVREGDGIGTNQGKVLRIDDNLMLVRESYIDHMGEQAIKEVEMRVRRNQEG